MDTFVDCLRRLEMNMLVEWYSDSNYELWGWTLCIFYYFRILAIIATTLFKCNRINNIDLLKIG